MDPLNVLAKVLLAAVKEAFRMPLSTVRHSIRLQLRALN